MGVYSTTAANAYADQIKAVYEYLDEVRKVAGRLTPVEDLISFQSQIQQLHSRLDLLVEASELIVTATETGEQILTGSVASIRTLLGIGNFPDWLVTIDELNALLDLLRGEMGTGLGGLIDGIAAINLTLQDLDQYRIIQQSQINGLQITYENVAGGLETNQLNYELMLQRLIVQEQFATLVDLHLESIDQNLASTILGIQASNSILSGHTASLQTAFNSISLHTASIDQLSSNYTDIDTNVTANTTALALMTTTIEGIGDDIIAQSQRTTALKSVIGGSGNLMPNADFSVGANGWNIVVAEEDWGSTPLTVNTYGSMPPEVNCLEVLGQPSPLGKIVVESPPVLLEGSNHYIVSGYPCVDNGIVELSYKAFDNAGGVVGQGACPPTFNVTTNANFSDYTRSWVKFLASTNAVKLRLYLTVTGDGDWITQGALFRPMVEKAWAEQAGPSAWTPNVSGAADALAEAVQNMYTDVSSIGDALSAQAGLITSLQAAVATLPTVFLQADPPTGGSYNVGDIWFETDNSNKQYIWDGTDWNDTATVSGSVNYAQPTMPTGGSYNVGDLWINTADNNRLHRWNGTAWVDISDPRVAAQGTAITELTTRVSSVEGINSSQSGAITALQATVSDPLTGLPSRASAAAVTALEARASATEGEIVAQSALLSTLTAGLNNANVGIASLATGVTSLTVRVTETENRVDLVTQNLFNRLDQIQNDNILTPDEKPGVILDYQAILDEQAGITAQAVVYGITTEKDAYTNAISALTSYLASLTTPTMWNDVSGYTNLT